MATEMQTAESSVDVKLPPEEAHKKWLEWTGEGGPGMPQGTSEKVGGAQISPELSKVEAGTANFDPSDDDGTKVRMQMRYNPSVIEQEGLRPEWVEQRITRYLSRFKNFAEGKPA